MTRAWTYNGNVIGDDSAMANHLYLLVSEQTGIDTMVRDAYYHWLYETYTIGDVFYMMTKEGVTLLSLIEEWLESARWFETEMRKMNELGIEWKEVM